MLRHNFWTEKGLVNGACGTEVDIIYEEGKSSPEDMPSILMCKFDNNRGPYLDDNFKTVPIPVISKSWNSITGKCVRCQFPIDQAYAVTIHKSQGMSLDKVRVNIVLYCGFCGEPISV
ncbi:ATP-dependent DNA helicase [Frankliniella fusca]|uniref:ATP-dependent DNA helicase n=1 Tax=Frankliniella fusca TaxID=407009 RepID=A0AAE1LB88_9NEOP|nr:ATP-dependent DNA helicase [Frankliniella fusca]